MVKLHQHLGFSYSKYLGFSPASGRRLRMGARRYRVTPAGARTLELLFQIYSSAQVGSERFWLLRQRPTIRQIQALNARSALSLVVEHTADPLLRLLATWLRGRCRGSLGRPSIAKFATHEDERLRREVARALTRMNAASDLQRLSTGDASANVRSLATASPPRPFPERLASFSGNVSHNDVRTPCFPWYISPAVELGERRRPKALWFIRLILERIHRLVSEKNT